MCLVCSPPPKSVCVLMRVGTLCTCRNVEIVWSLTWSRLVWRQGSVATCSVRLSITLQTLARSMSKNENSGEDKRRRERHFDRNTYRNRWAAHCTLTLADSCAASGLDSSKTQMLCDDVDRWRRIVWKKNKRNDFRMRGQSLSRKPRICWYLNQSMMTNQRGRQLRQRS